MSTFGTLNTGVLGLFAAQRAMETTSQNVVNANTPGYSRQRVQQQSVGAPPAATFHTGSSTAIGGVRVTDVTRIKDIFVEATRAAAGARQNALEAQQTVLNGTQLLFAEPGDNGLQSGLDSFFAAWHELASNPADSAAGSVVIQKGLAVADQLHTVSNGITSQWSQAYDRLDQAVDQANQAAENLTSLNSQILEGQAAGRPVNELLDQRDTVVRTLADLLGGVGSLGDDGQISVSVNGITVVAGSTRQPIQLLGATSIDNAVADPPRLTWAGLSIPVESGAAAGYLATLRTDLPNLAASVDTVAVALRDAVNTVHATGFTLAGNPGGAFFAGTGARDLTVVPTVPDDLAMTSAAGTVDGAVAMGIGDLANDTTVAGVLGGPGPTARWGASSRRRKRSSTPAIR